MSEVTRAVITRAVEAAKQRHEEVMALHQPVDSPSGILNRVAISRIYDEKYGRDQELIDWRLRMHAIGGYVLPATLVKRLEAGENPQTALINSTEPEAPKHHKTTVSVRQLLELDAAAIEYASANTDRNASASQWIEAYDVAMQFFEDSARQGEVR